MHKMPEGIIQQIIKSGKREGTYYLPVPATVPAETRRLFEEYVGIAPDDVIPHLAEFVRILLSGASPRLLWSATV